LRHAVPGRHELAPGNVASHSRAVEDCAHPWPDHDRGRRATVSRRGLPVPQPVSSGSLALGHILAVSHFVGDAGGGTYWRTGGSRIGASFARTHRSAVPSFGPGHRRSVWRVGGLSLDHAFAAKAYPGGPMLHFYLQPLCALLGYAQLCQFVLGEVPFHPLAQVTGGLFGVLAVFPLIMLLLRRLT